jgi:hypothetical protein
VQRKEVLIHADRRITIDIVPTAIGYAHGLTYSTIHDKFEVSESVCTVNWQEGYCFIMTMPDPMQPEQNSRTTVGTS